MSSGSLRNIGSRLPDIFLSYSREDQATARRFAEGFEREGLSVWWDQTLSAGEAYDEVTEKALNEAKAVVVLWSKTSVASRWVRAEATQANESRSLVPVMIEPCKRPIMFELTHTADLSHWKGDTSDKAWRTYVADVRRFVQRGEPAQSVPQAQSRPNQSPRFGGRSIAILAAIVIIAGGILWTVTRTGGKTPSQAASTVQVGASPSGAKAVSAPVGVSLAVLPFVDMSPEHNQEYFSDGLSEELLNQLAQIKELSVAGRTSSFSFKGKNEDLRVIGEKLGVSNILEGSVRREGNHLRITAQLINSKGGTHLWSQTFDRELKGVFAVQEEIAKDVSRALSITLDVGSMSHAKGGTTNVEAYDKFLRAQEFSYMGGPKEDVQAATLYREAVTLDPAFVRAWWGLRNVLGALRDWYPEQTEIGKEIAQTEARIAGLVPEAWWTQAIRADQFSLQHKWSEANTAMSAAMAAAPASENYCGIDSFVSYVGRINVAVQCMERARQTDPLSLYISGGLQFALDLAGRPEEAQAEYERSKRLAGDHREWAHIALIRLLYRKNVDPATLKAQFRKYASDASIQWRLDQTLVDRLDDKEAARAAIHRAYEDPANGDQLRTLILMIYADRFGDRDLALTALRRYLFEAGGRSLGWLWIPSMTSMRADPRFKDILRDLGLVAFFRASGNWGDFCRPVGSDDFECH
jgi:TolB-like protein